MKHSRVTFNLDLGDTISDISIPIKKTAKVLNIILMENGQPYEIESDCKVVFYAKKPDGNVLYNDCIVKDNVVEYQLTTQTIALAGIIECELLVYGEDSSTPIHSPSFTLVNYEPVFDGGEAVESTNEFTALTQAMGTLETLIDQAKDVIGSNTDDYIIHAPNYISSNTTPSDIEFGTHVCAITEFDSTLPESDEEYTVQGTLEVIKAFDSIDCIRMYWHPCGSHNVYSRLPITDQNWSEWETAQSGSGVSESVVNEKVATAKRELIGTADDGADKDTIKGAKQLTLDLMHSLEDKVVKTTELNNAINNALSQAKESGEFDGANGKDGTNGLSAYQIWLQQGNTGSEADFLESLKGANGKDGQDGADGINGTDGKDGTNGADGADGTSVTVQSVTESTADGGENIVTFSNGQTLKVKNGSKGSKGDKGDPGEKGDSYVLTEDDKEEIVDSLASEIITQEVGESESLVMSQKAATEALGNKLDVSAPINPSWGKWDDVRYNYGFDKNTQPIFNTVGGTLESDTMISVRGGKGRWGWHNFEGWSPNELSRLTMLMGKHHETFGYIQTFSPNGLYADRNRWGWIKVGCDELNEGTDFSKNWTTCYTPITLAPQTAPNSVADYDLNPQFTSNAVPYGTMYFDEEQQRIMLYTKTGWNPIAFVGEGGGGSGGEEEFYEPIPSYKNGYYVQVETSKIVSAGSNGRLASFRLNKNTNYTVTRSALSARFRIYLYYNTSMDDAIEKGEVGTLIAQDSSHTALSTLSFTNTDFAMAVVMLSNKGDTTTTITAEITE